LEICELEWTWDVIAFRLSTSWARLRATAFICHFLDPEGFKPAIPILQRTRTYKRLPFNIFIFLQTEILLELCKTRL